MGVDAVQSEVIPNGRTITEPSSPQRREYAMKAQATSPAFRFRAQPSRPARRSRTRITWCLLVALFGGALTPSLRADVSLPAILSDGMVLQRETSAPLWGWAAPGSKVTITASWTEASVSTQTNAEGKWRTQLETPPAGGPHTIDFRTERGQLQLRDVWIGEVWICSGQSNMEWPVSDSDADPTFPPKSIPELRLFRVPHTISIPERNNCDGQWVASTPETAAGFSAVAYRFGRSLHAQLGVPIGLIQATWGGTVVEAWMDGDTARRIPPLAAEQKRLQALVDPNLRAQLRAGSQESWWERLDRKAPGAEQWKSPTTDASNWSRTELPGTYSTHDLGGFDGVVFYRKTVRLERALTEASTLHLGPIDDYDDVWVNGVKVGSVHESGRWNQPRSYTVPASATRAGANVVAIRVLDTGGPGGLHGSADQLRWSLPSGSDVSLSGEWRYASGLTAGELGPIGQGGRIAQNSPTVLFNGMIAPVVPFRLRGAIWYQGESNVGRAAEYEERFPALIEGWRRRWQQGDFPFYFVQIAPYRYQNDQGAAASLREAQRRSLACPNTAMVVTLDIGDPADIHPRNKHEVGRRLALNALVRDYGRTDLLASGPRYRKHEVEGNAIRLHFDSIGSGLILRRSPREHFMIAGADKRFYRAQAQVAGDTILVRSPRAPKPVAVRYAWEAACEPNLFNGNGLPSSSFRTDSWQDPLPPVNNDDQVAAFRSREDGFVPLFNGVDLDGWQNVNCAPSTWQAREGVIYCTGIPTGELRTEKQYQNFILELEWRHLRPGGNAGLFVWSDPLTARGQPFTRSVEVQVMDGLEQAWFTSDGDVFPIHGATMKPINSRGGQRAFPTERRANPSPQWNHYRVECIDGRLNLAVNGKIVTRATDASPRRGYICLESEGSPVEFREIRIKELPGKELPPEQRANDARGFVPLYNGVDLTGWRQDPAPQGWQALDWILGFSGQGSDLWTEKSYRDFELICDWRWTAPPVDTERPVIAADGTEASNADGTAKTQSVPDAGDSGIYLRGNSKSQVNIWCWPVGSGEVYGYRTDTNQPPHVRAGVTPNRAADAPIGQWNRFEITLRGQRLTVVLNGERVISNALLPGIPATGPIGLQNHGNPIQFANLFIRELPASEEF